MLHRKYEYIRTHLLHLHTEPVRALMAEMSLSSSSSSGNIFAAAREVFMKSLDLIKSESMGDTPPKITLFSNCLDASSSLKSNGFAIFKKKIGDRSTVKVYTVPKPAHDVRTMLQDGVTTSIQRPYNVVLTPCADRVGSP